MIEIALEFEDRELLTELKPNIVSQAERQGIDGSTMVYLVVIALAPVAIKATAEVLKAHIAAKKPIKIKYKGIAIENTSEDLAERLIRLSEKEHAKK